ncbi:ribose-phosphate pyrophosphokinase [Paenibacillus aurantius]|uniref:Ribose-phosphate pyrophosphokinase n=1 Tax=Paenibacillus aurantius TaxID=2918900 RepID=A0AA96LBX2_9BACL|nr:ribose-phosphate pyrophosphokinase [Paenibacillus aurantius]WNQ10867.1 ribose-phosphate pyrophosphokinase [Paenibacillus aurantius]
MNQFKIFTGTAHRGLAEEIAGRLGMALGDLTCSHFSDGEIRVDLNETVRGFHVFLIQPTAPAEGRSVNDHLMELMIIVDAMRRASADSITLLVPYFGYARQDRKNGTRSPITAKVVARMLETSGVSRILTLDLHSDQIQGFVDIPMDNLNATALIASYLNRQKLDNPVVVSPDMGGTKRASKLARLIPQASIAVIDKRRPQPNVSEVLHLVGDVAGKTAVIIDDMIDTAGTIVNAAQALKDRGTIRVIVACTHPVLSGEAISRLKAAPVDEVIVCNTMDIPEKKRLDKLTVLSVGPLLAQALTRIHNKEPLTEIIEGNIALEELP